MPDLTAMAKILAGGMPGGAVCGRKDILDWLDLRSGRGGQARAHQPSGHAQRASGQRRGGNRDARDRPRFRCLREGVGDGGERCAQGMNEVLEAERVPWAVYGEHSFFHIYSNPQGEAIRPTAFDARTITMEKLKGKDERCSAKLRLAMLVNGVDLKGFRGGIVSAAHTQADVEFTLDAWRKSLRMLKEEEALSA